MPTEMEFRDRDCLIRRDDNGELYIACDDDDVTNEMIAEIDRRADLMREQIRLNPSKFALIRITDRPEKRWGECMACGDPMDPHRGGMCMICVAALRKTRR